MASPFVHLEILGPRVSLDAWLSVVQDHGGCHLADAAEGLAGEAGIGRPRATPEEWEGRALRAEAARALRAVERVLPGSAPGEDPRDRPSFSIGARGEGREDLERLVAEAAEVAGRIRSGLEVARRAENARTEREAESLAVESLARFDIPKVDGHAWAVPLEGGGARAHVRALRAAGLEAALADGRREAVIVARGEGAAGAAAEIEAVGEVARTVALPAEESERDLPSAVETAQARATESRDALTAAVAGLREAVDRDGPRARELLDALDDAEARLDARDRLAATEHAAAARVFVRREDEAQLRRGLEIAFGREVLVRDLGPAADAPALPRAVAGLPLAALQGLSPSRFGEVATASLLALFVPLAVGAALADIGVGLLLLITGALVGLGAPPGSPRRDTSLLAELSGLVALLLGLVEGRAFGAAGETWLGRGWGLLGEGSLLGQLEPLPALVLRVGTVAGLLFLWGLVCVVVNLRRRQRTRVLSAAVGALSALAVAGAGTLAVPDDLPAWLFAVVPLAAVGTWLLAGFRLGLGRFLLDLVAVLRLVGVAYLAMLLLGSGFAALLAPDVLHWILGISALVVGALAVTIDPAYVAMGVPYDLALGSHALTHPFTPFRRRAVQSGGGGVTT